MKTLYLDCGMGAAGDMLAAALLELLPDPEGFLAELNALGIPDVEIKAEPSVKCGITGTKLVVTVGGIEEGMFDPHGHHHGHSHESGDGHEHSHESGDGHEHSHGPGEHGHTHAPGVPHHHNGMAEIEEIVRLLGLPANVQRDVMAVYRHIAEAESRAHGVPVVDIHFHEVGAMDAIADITAVCLLMDRIAPDQVIASPVHVGSGHVRCAHGILPVPAPATAYILQGVPVYGGGIKSELCTPTGAALLKHFVTRFGDMPAMNVSAIGYGMGAKDFEAANCVRAMLGETAGGGDAVVELSCNLDDMTPEAVGFAMDRLFEGGALEVYTVPVGMKKSRPGVLLCAICSEADVDAMVKLVFAHTTTLGIRRNDCERYTLSRDVHEIDTPFGCVRQKRSAGYGIVRVKLEHDDIARIAKEQGLSLPDVVSRISKEQEM